MLVLMRGVGESIRIGDDIEVVIVAIRIGRVRIGISAPPHVAIDRSEVRERLRQELPGVEIDIEGDACSS